MKLTRRGEHTEGVSETCEYQAYRAGIASCGAPSAGELRAHSMEHRLPWGLCAEHLKPEAHPLDLRSHLYCW